MSSECVERPVPGDQDGRSDLLVLAPLRIEARAVRRGLGPGAHVLPTGMGPRHALTAPVARFPGNAVAVSGFCGGLDPSLVPGELVVATEVRGPDGVIACPGAGVLAGALRRRRLRVRLGPIVSTSRIVRGAERERLAATGALAVDMESAWLAGAAGGRPLAVVRAVVDTSAREITRPLALVNGAGRAYWALRQAAAVLSEWAAAVGPRTILLAAPASVRARASSGRSRSSSARSSASVRRCTSGARSSTTRTSSPSSRRAARCSWRRSTRCPTARGSSSPRTACPPPFARTRPSAGSTSSTRRAPSSARCTPRRGASPSGLHDRARRS